MRTAVEARELLPKGLRIEGPGIGPGRVGISVSSGAEGCGCPLCGRRSCRAHSRYHRNVSGRPWHGISVELGVRARRFSCGAASCERRICRVLGVSARTVCRYKDLEEPPPRRSHGRRGSVLDPYVPYLLERWGEGCKNAKRPFRGIRERGYRNSEETCARFVAQPRRAEADGKPPSSVPRARRGSIAGLSPTSKNVAALSVRREEKLPRNRRRTWRGSATPTGRSPMPAG